MLPASSETGSPAAALGAATDESAAPSAQAAIDEALRGLSFAGGRVVVSARAADRLAARRLLADGFARRDRGESVEALRSFAAAVLAAPDEPVAFEALAQALVYRNRLEQAMDSLRTAEALVPPAPSPTTRWPASDGCATTSPPRSGVGSASSSSNRTTLEPTPAWPQPCGTPATSRGRAVTTFGPLSSVACPRSSSRRSSASRGPAKRGIDKPGRGCGPVPRISTAAQVAAAPVISAPVQVDIDGAKAAEVSVAAAGNRVVVAWNDERDPGTNGGWRLGVAWSDDGGDSWSDQILAPPGGSARSSYGDPMTAVDSVTGDLWVGGIDFGSGGQTYLARWAPGAPGLSPPVTLLSGSLHDKAFAAAGLAPGAPGSSRLYVASVRGLQTSADRGAMWSAPILLGPEGVYDLGHVPRVDADGRLYVVYWDFDDGIWLQRSLDGGATVDPPRRIATRLDAWPLLDGSRFPGLFRVPPLPFMTIDAVGRVYVVWSDTTAMVGADSDVDVYLIRSDDQEPRGPRRGARRRPRRRRRSVLLMDRGRPLRAPPPPVVRHRQRRPGRRHTARDDRRVLRLEPGPGRHLERDAR